MNSFKGLILLAAIVAVSFAQCDEGACEAAWNTNVGSTISWEAAFGHCGRWVCIQDQCTLEPLFDGCCDLEEACNTLFGTADPAECNLYSISPFPFCCENNPDICNDGNDCTLDECLPSSTSNVPVCVNTPLPGDDCCARDSDCPIYPCRAVECRQGTCEYTDITPCSSNACNPQDVAGTCPTPPPCRLAVCNEEVNADGTPISGTGVCGTVPDFTNAECCFDVEHCYDAANQGQIGPLGECEQWICINNECVAVTITGCESGCQNDDECPQPPGPCSNAICVDGVCRNSTSLAGNDDCCVDDADCFDPNTPCARHLCVEDPDTGRRYCVLDQNSVDPDCCTSDDYCYFALGIPPNDPCTKVECLRGDPVAGSWSPGSCVAYTDPDCCTEDADCPPPSNGISWFCRDGDCFPKLECSIDNECNDNDPCTTDNCINGVCRYTPNGECCTRDEQCPDHPDPCIEYDCVAGECVANIVPMCCTADDDCDSADDCVKDKCFHNKCVPIRVCCTTDEDCDDRSCSIPHCDLDTRQCRNVFIDELCCTGDGNCDDDNPCTKDYCDEYGRCHFEEIADCCITAEDCGETGPCRNAICTTDNQCEVSIVPDCCVNSNDCYDGSDCTRDFCACPQNDPGCTDKTCFNIPVTDDCCTKDSDCEDNNPWTIHECRSGECVYTAIGCRADHDCVGLESGDDCAVAFCDSTYHCRVKRDDDCCTKNSDCPDGYYCGPVGTIPTYNELGFTVLDTANPARRECHPLPPDCTTDAECDDSIDCTVDVCDPSIGKCIHKWDRSLDGCCLRPADCVDATHSPSDYWMTCVHGECHYRPRQCDPSAVDGGADACNDGIPCTRDTCNDDGTCAHFPIENCCVSDDQCAATALDSCTDKVCRKRPGRVRGKCVDAPHPENPAELQESGRCCGKDDDCDACPSCHHGICSYGKCFCEPTFDGVNCTEPCPDDENPCTDEVIVDGVCRHVPIPHCCVSNFDCYSDDEWVDRDRCHPRVCMDGVCNSLDLTGRGCCNDNDDCVAASGSDRAVCRDGECVEIVKDCTASSECTERPDACHEAVCTPNGCAYPRIDGCCTDRSDCYGVGGGLDNDCDFWTCRGSVAGDLGGGPGRCERRTDKNCCSNDRDCKEGVVENDSPDACPSSSPVRCADGSCRAGGDDCVLTTNVCHLRRCVEPETECESASDCVSGPCERASCVNGECVGHMKIDNCCEDDSQCSGANDKCKRYHCNERTHTCQATLSEECCHCDEDCEAIAKPGEICKCNRDGGCDCRPVGSGCSDDIDCDDNSACTRDACTASGICVYEAIDDCCGYLFDDGTTTGGLIECDDGNACTHDYCNFDTGACIYEPVDDCCVDDDECIPANADPCSTYHCNPATGTCFEVHNGNAGSVGVDCGCTSDDECVSDDPCIDSFCRQGECIKVPNDDCCFDDEDCRERRLASGTNYWPDHCVKDLCIDGDCIYRLRPGCECLDGSDCDDGLLCTEDICVNDQCQHIQTCCDPDAGPDACPEDPTRPCQRRECLETSIGTYECVTTDIPPPDCCTRDEQCESDNDDCTVELCDPDTHMCLPPVDISGTANTTCCTDVNDCDWLQAQLAATGEDVCRAAECRNGHCQVVSKPDCCRTDAECDDGRKCTIDSCDPTTGDCTYDDTNCDECNDQLPCPTGQECVNGVCVNVTSDCTTHEECDDGDECTRDGCINGECVFYPRPDCCREDDDCPEVMPEELAKCWAYECRNHHCHLVAINHQDCCHDDDDCDDDDPTTDDTCNDDGSCNNDPTGCETDAQCDTGVPCYRGVCVDGVCAQVWDLDLCCVDDANCDDGDDCTRDQCTSTGNCIHTWISQCCQDDEVCQDDNECTVDECINHVCVHTPIATSDGYCCTDHKECDDNDRCTRDFCKDDICVNYPIPGCCRHDKECPDEPGAVGICVDGFCDLEPIPGWCNDDRVCDDQDPCTEDKCVRQHCVNRAIPDCEGCRHDRECEDGDACTKDRCINGQCVSSQLKPGEHGTDCECYDNRHCDDGNECTSDVCVDGHCRHNLGACCEHQDCHDGDICTIDLCVETSSGERLCMYQRVTPGDPDWPECECYTADDCVPPAGTPACAEARCRAGHCFWDYSDCSECVQDRDCNDNDPCTKDYCDATTNECFYEEIIDCCSNATLTGSLFPHRCDDGDPCTHDYCGPDGQCIFEGTDECCNPLIDAIQCNDNNRCTRDYCSEDGQCMYDPIPGCCFHDRECNDFDECTHDFCNPDTGFCDYEHKVDEDGNKLECCDNHDDCIPIDHDDPCIRYWCDRPLLYVASTGTPIYGPGVCHEENVCGDCTGTGCDDGDICTDDTCVTNPDGSSRCRHEPIPGCCVVDCDCDMPTRPSPQDSVSIHAHMGGGGAGGKVTLGVVTSVQYPYQLLTSVQYPYQLGAREIVPSSRALRGNRPVSSGGKCVNNRCWTPPKNDFCDTVRCQEHPDPCFKYVCNSASQTCEEVFVCCLNSKDCDDGDSCTIDKCHTIDNGDGDLELGKCRYMSIKGCCNDEHPDCSAYDDLANCLVGVCDGERERCRQRRIPGCCVTHRDCPDNHMCEHSSSGAGECVPRPECTADSECPQSSHPCKRLECDLRPDSASFETCIPVHRAGCCLYDRDCDDGVVSTIDKCVDNTCVNRPRPGTCFADADCEAGVDTTCFDVHCNDEGLCEKLPLVGSGANGCCVVDEDCDDDPDDCVDVTCDGQGQCVASTRADCCDSDADCRDQLSLDTCARVTCDPRNRTCIVHEGQDYSCCESDADCPNGSNECMIGVCERQITPGQQLHLPPIDKSRCRYIPNPDANCCETRKDCRSLDNPCAGEFHDCIDGTCQVVSSSDPLPAGSCCEDADCQDDDLGCAQATCVSGLCVLTHSNTAGGDECFGNLSPTLGTTDETGDDDDNDGGSSPVVIFGAIGVIFVAIIAFYIFFGAGAGGAAATTTVGSAAASSAGASSAAKI